MKREERRRCEREKEKNDDKVRRGKRNLRRQGGLRKVKELD